MKINMSHLKKINVLTNLNDTLHEIFLSQSIPTIHDLLQYARQNNLRKKEELKGYFQNFKSFFY